MIYDEFLTIARHALRQHRGADSLQLVAIEPSGMGPRIKWEAPLLSRERERKAGGVLGPVAGPVILGVLVRTLAVRWWKGAPYCAHDWDEQMAVQYRRIFQKQAPDTGPGWRWLWEGGAQSIVAAGVPRGFHTVQTKEKFGSIRWYHEAEENSTKVYDIIDAVEHLSAFICEDCGRPGRIRRGSWIKCLCDVHAKGRPGG